MELESYYGAAWRAARRNLDSADIKGPYQLLVLRLYPLTRDFDPVTVYLFGESHYKSEEACGPFYYTIKEWLRATDDAIDKAHQEVHLVTEDKPFGGRHRQENWGTQVITDWLKLYRRQRQPDAFLADVWSFKPDRMHLHRIDGRFLPFVNTHFRNIEKRIKEWRAYIYDHCDNYEVDSWDEELDAARQKTQQIGTAISQYRDLCQAVIDFTTEDPFGRIMTALNVAGEGGEKYEEQVRRYVDERRALLDCIPVRKQRAWQIDLIREVKQYADVLTATMNETMMRINDLVRERRRILQSIRQSSHHDTDEDKDRYLSRFSSTTRQMMETVRPNNHYIGILEDIDLPVMDHLCMLSFLSILHRQNPERKSRIIIGYFGSFHTNRYEAWLRWIYDHDNPPVFEQRKMSEVTPQCVYGVPSIRRATQEQVLPAPLSPIEEEVDAHGAASSSVPDS